MTGRTFGFGWAALAAAGIYVVAVGGVLLAGHLLGAW